MGLNKPKLCIIVASDPNFLGGLGLYQKNIMSCLNKYFEISLVYKGSKYEEITENGIKIFQIKSTNKSFLGNFLFDYKVKSFLKKHDFNIINSQGLTGLWMKARKDKSKIVHTYHGSTYHFYKNHLMRFGNIMRLLYSPILFFPYLFERCPMKNADKIICVSEHVKDLLISLYGNRENITFLRTGVDLSSFKPKDKFTARKELNFPEDNLYGLYVGRGGFWTKGLDKVMNLSKEIYRLNNKFRLIIVGAETEKVKHLIDNRFTLILPPQTRENIPYYYNMADLFFSMSRCEGGSPTMVTSEAMASGCLVVTDKEATQEIFEDEKNGLIITEEYKLEAQRILNVLNDKKKLNNIVENSINTSKDLSLNIWAKKYLDLLTN